jgi:tetratricopeptide (TPR) repeat protein
MDPQREAGAPAPAQSFEQLLARSAAAYAAGNLAAALDVLDLAPPAGTDSITVVDQVRLLTQRGKILTGQAFLTGVDLEPAITVLLNAVQLARTTASASAIADALSELGAAYFYRCLADDRADYAEAASVFNQALALYKQTSNFCGLALTLFQIGMIAERRDDQTQALVQYQKAHTIAEQYQCTFALAAIERHLGFHYARIGDKAAALACLQRSLALYDQIGFVLFRPYMLMAVGAALKAQGSWSAAAEYYARADELARTLGATRARLAVAIAQAELYEEQGHRTAARQSYLQARDLAADLGDAAGLVRCEAKLRALGPT